MPDALHLKVLRPSSPIDALISYMTDVRPLLADHADWLAGEHPRGEAFVAEVLGPATGVLKAASAVARETAEAGVATQVQDELLRAGAVCARALRKTGEFVASEFEATPDGAEQARALRAACGVASRARLDRQSGVRRLLDTQVSSLAGLSDTVAQWPRMNKHLDEAKSLLARITAAIEAQSKESLDADCAQDALTETMDAAVTQVNRAVRVVDIAGDEAPQALLRGLLSLQAHHTHVYHRRAEAAAPPVTEAEPTEAPA